MVYKDYEIVKLEEKDTGRIVFASILRIKGDVYTLKMVVNEPHNLHYNEYADNVFVTHTNSFDIEDSVKLEYNSAFKTFKVHKDMLLKVSEAQLKKIIHHMIYTNFNNNTKEKAILYCAVEQLLEMTNKKGTD